MYSNVNCIELVWSYIKGCVTRSSKYVELQKCVSWFALL
jgi:hypothetical protein